MTSYDVIVIGVGSMGAATCCRLAERGCKVLGIEQFDSPHAQGSHAGQSRIIRKAYFEHPDYVPLLQRAYRNWGQLEVQTGEQVYFKTGLIYHGPHRHPVMQGTIKAAFLHNIELKELTHEQTKGRYPQYSIAGDFKTLYEPDAGFLRPEKIITLYKNEAIKKGATIYTNERVLHWSKNNDEIKVTTGKNVYYTKKLIITAGAWAGKILAQVNDKLKITRQVIIWMKPADEKLFSASQFPCWLIADDKRQGALYGFPFLDAKSFGEPEGLKFAWHHAADETDPDAVNREVTSDEAEQLIRAVTGYIPAVASAKIAAVKTCLYANSPDEDFIIDHLPGYNESVIVACGFSGHGFKFVSVLGEILADLAMNGRTALPIGFLGLKRFQE